MNHCFFLDSVHAAVQSSGQAAAAEVVLGADREEQEEALEGAHPGHPRAQAQDELIPRVQGPQDRLQEVSCHFPTIAD